MRSSECSGISDGVCGIIDTHTVRSGSAVHNDRSVNGVEITKDIDEFGIFNCRLIEGLATSDVSGLPMTGLATNGDEVIAFTEIEGDVSIDGANRNGVITRSRVQLDSDIRREVEGEGVITASEVNLEGVGGIDHRSAIGLREEAIDEEDVFWNSEAGNLNGIARLRDWFFRGVEGFLTTEIDERFVTAIALLKRTS